MTKTTLLIDGDLFAYQLAAGCEKGTDFGEGGYVLTADPEVASQNLDGLFKGYLEALKADDIIVALSDTLNYRKVVMPSYKSNRDRVRRPMVLGALKEHLIKNYEVVIKPTLEADDVLGILATHPTRIPGYKIVVTEDKDLRSVPGYHWNPKKEGLESLQPTEVTLKEADINFYCQVLSGDTVDGYGGCPGIGKAKARKIVEDPFLRVYNEEIIQRGKNAGKTRGFFSNEPTDDLWAAIVSHYEAEGLTDIDAIRTAQVARILRYEDYDFKNKGPKLWMPNQ